MKNKISTTILLLALLAALMPAASVVHAQEPEYVIVDIQPDGTNGKDAQIANVAPGTNYGTAANMGVGEHNAIEASIRRSLLQFDLSGLPYDMGVISASLTLTVDENLSSNARTMYAYAINNTWNETQVSWNNRITGTAWQTAGASGGNDMVAEPIGSVAVPATLSPGDTVVIPLDPESVEYLRYNNYFGIILRMDVETDDLYFFRSSDHGTEADRPKLTIEYDPDVLATDPGWVCIDGTYGSLGGHADCVEYSPFTDNPISPFIISRGFSVDTNVSFGTGYGMGGAKIQCEPYPRCVDDHPIYYRLEYTYSWRSNQANSYAHPRFRFAIPGVTDSYYITDEINCGVGAPGHDCAGVIEGVILPSSLPENNDGFFTLGLYVTANTGIYLITWKSLSYTLYISTLPFSQECSDTWYVPIPETFEIDPTIETPLGVEGEPADHQIYPTVIGQNYMVRVEDGPWHDGTDYRTDAAVSFDGETWISWAEFAALAFCLDVIPQTMENPDYKVIYFEATTENFYIRVNDTAGNFGNNSNDFQTPYKYVIGIAFELAQPVSCDSQFAYDPVNDLAAEITVVSTWEPGHLANALQDLLEVGEWYAIEVVSGTWNEPAGPPRVDMEYRFQTADTELYYPDEYTDLAEGAEHVWCESEDSDIVFVQAPANWLYLRANDQDDNFANNTGSLTVKIYHAEFTRIVDGCELQFSRADLAGSGTVEATKMFGVSMATYPVAFNFGSGVQNWIQSATNSSQYVLTPGGWYLLETTLGPWSNLTDKRERYDMEIKVGGDEWVDLDQWAGAECIVPVDALGHLNVWFQVPEDEDLFGQPFLLRVNGTYFPLNLGSMSWNLYHGMDLGLPTSEPGSCSNYQYDPDYATGTGRVDSWLENGSTINGLETGQYYAIHIESANTASDAPYFEHSGWWESASSEEERDDLQLTVDGTTWATLPNHPAVLCYYYTPETDELVYFVRVLHNQQWKMRANSSTFGNNVGSVLYETLPATAGDPWNTCAADYTATVPAINEHEWIPPQDEEGIMIMPTLTYVPSQEDGPEWYNLFLGGTNSWGLPGLAPDHTYMVSTQNGPWYDGENPTNRYTAQLSSDGGENWYAFKDHPDVICATIDQLGWYEKAIFDVTTGQQWKIRVADADTDTFLDNTGNLAYKLNLVNEFPIDGPGSFATDYNPGEFDVCTQSLVRPQTLAISEIGSLGNYLGDWVQYINRSLLSYFAWCPRHTDMIISAMRALMTKEPLATIAEMRTVSNNVAADVNSYDWEGGYEDTSIFGVSSVADVNALSEKILPQGGVAASPWQDGGNMVNFNSGNDALPSYYYTCDSVFTNYLPSRIRTGVCFTSAYWRETGASFWVQISLDIGAIFLLFRMIKSAAQSLVYMMTGVRPWTKDGASKMIVEIASGSELIQPVERWRTGRR